MISYGYGPEHEDAISGWRFPAMFMVKDQSGEVSRFYRDNSWDLFFSDKLDNSRAGARVDVPVLSIQADVATATFIPHSDSSFTITRVGDNTTAFNILLHIKGTARNGIDYQFISPVQSMPAGINTITIPVVPIAIPPVGGVDVVMTIVPTTGSEYYLSFTKTPVVGPNTATDAFTVVVNNSATISIPT